MGCEFLYNQNRVRVVGSQLFRAAGNTETGFSDLIYIALLTACQSVIKGVHVRASGVLPISMSPTGLFNLYLRFWLKMLLRRRLQVEAQIHYPLCFGRYQVVVYISLGTSRSLNSFNCRSLYLRPSPIVRDSPGSMCCVL